MDVTSRQVLIFNMMIGIASTNRGECEMGTSSGSVDGDVTYNGVADGDASLPPPRSFLCTEGAPWLPMPMLDVMLIVINLLFCVRVLSLLEFFDIIHKAIY